MRSVCGCVLYIVCTVHNIEYVCIEYVLYSVCDLRMCAHCLLSVLYIMWGWFVFFTVVFILCMILDMYILSTHCLFVLL